MSKDFDIDELYELIRTDTEYPCGLDEVLSLLAEYIDDEKITREINQYIDWYYQDLGIKGEY